MDNKCKKYFTNSLNGDLHLETRYFDHELWSYRVETSSRPTHPELETLRRLYL